MAAKKGAKKGEVKGASRYYEVTGDTIKSKKSVCPRCGNGVFLAEPCRPAKLRQVRLYGVQEIDHSGPDLGPDFLDLISLFF